MGRRYGIGGPWILRGVDLDLPGQGRGRALVRIEGANGRLVRGRISDAAAPGPLVRIEAVGPAGASLPAGLPGSPDCVAAAVVCALSSRRG